MRSQSAEHIHRVGKIQEGGIGKALRRLDRLHAPGGDAEGFILQVGKADAFLAPYQQVAALVGCRAEQHALRPLLGDRDAGGCEVALLRLYRRQNPVEVHGNHLQPVTVRLAEPGRNIHVVAHDEVVLHIGKGKRRGVHRHAQRPVHGGQRLIVQDGLPVLVQAEPDAVDLRHGAVRPEAFHKSAELAAQGLSLLRFGKHRGDVGAVHRLADNLQVCVFIQQIPGDGLVGAPVIHLAGAQRQHAVDHGRVVADLHVPDDLPALPVAHGSALYRDLRPPEPGKISVGAGHPRQQKQRQDQQKNPFFHSNPSL